jgi:hypothetical protein
MAEQLVVPSVHYNICHSDENFVRCLAAGLVCFHAAMQHCQHRSGKATEFGMGKACSREELMWDTILVQCYNYEARASEWVVCPS